jgi:hypothetical protein
MSEQSVKDTKVEEATCCGHCGGAESAKPQAEPVKVEAEPRPAPAVARKGCGCAG